MEVRELVAAGEVAIGMSLDEVAASLGEPTKTKVRQTAKGQSGQWEFIVYEEQKHYQLVRDPLTGALYNQYTHTTLEETSKLVVEFENDVVTAIEESIIEVLGSWGIEGSARPDAPGVYIDGAKIAALGLRIRKGCSYHGLAVNVNMDLSPYQRINPCGLIGIDVTQTVDLGGPADIDALKAPLGEQLKSRLS